MSISCDLKWEALEAVPSTVVLFKSDTLHEKNKRKSRFCDLTSNLLVTRAVLKDLATFGLYLVIQ